MAIRKKDQEMLDAYDNAATGGGYAHLYGLRAVAALAGRDVFQRLERAEAVAKAAVLVVEGWPDAMKLDENDMPIENNEQAARCGALEAAVKSYKGAP